MNQVFKLKKPPDAAIPVIGVGLSIFGLVMILSASQVIGLERFGSSFYFFTKQLMAWILGMVVFFVVMKYPVEDLFERRNFFLGVALVLLILVFIPIIGPKIASVNRWVDLYIVTIQSAEVAKILLLIFFAAFLARKQEVIADPLKTLLPYLGVLGISVLLIVAEPDLGTAIIIIIMALAMLFVAKLPILQYLALVISAVILVVTLIYSSPYRQERFMAYLKMNKNQSEKLDSNYHAHQALIAIGSGGLWGVGFGKSTSKFAYLPEAHTDSIFAIIAEELGFVRTSIIILAYLILLWRLFILVLRANSHFVKYLAVGIMTLLISQTLLNIVGLMSLIPFTGVPIPFLSYGGSSLVVSLSLLGLATNISREIE